MTNKQNQTNQELNEADEQLATYLDRNPLIAKWETTGLFEQVETNSEKYLISSVMESVLYKMFEMKYKEGKSQEDIMAYHDSFLTKMRELGVFNGNLLKNVN